MADPKNPAGRPLGHERKTDQQGDVDEGVRGRHGGPDVDTEKREKELEKGSGR